MKGWNQNSVNALIKKGLIKRVGDEIDIVGRILDPRIDY